MALLYADGTKDVYVWTDPTFDSEAECVDFVAYNNHFIYDHLTNIFGNIDLEALYCATEQDIQPIIGQNT